MSPLIFPQIPVHLGSLNGRLDKAFVRDFSLDARFPCARERTFSCARPRTTDVGAREMPRSVVTVVCKESEFAKEIARLANLDST
jgi:hypothetical protein